MDSKIKRIVLLGHTGFIGGHLMRHLSAAYPDLEIVGQAPVSLDLTRDGRVAALDGLLDPTTAVVMLAAVKRQFGDNLDAFSRNLSMVMNLSRLLHDHPVARLIYFSSAAVYGEETHDTRITEKSCVNPMSYYGAAKFAGECLLRKLIAAKPEISLLCLRPPLVYGAGDRGETYGPSGFVRSALRGDKITLWGDGAELREFIYVEDLTQIVSRLVFHDCYGVLNVASGTSYSFRVAVDLLARLIPVPLDIGSRPRTKERVDNAFINTLLRALLPDQHFTPLEEGLRRTLAADREALNA
jgi:UDP-glucose 4-epimerase